MTRTGRADGTPEPIWASTDQQAQGRDRPRSGGTQPPAWTQSITSTAPVPGPPGFFYADVPNRIIAYVIDLIVLAVIGIFVALLLGSVFGGIVSDPGAIDGTGGELNVGLFVILSLVQLAVSFGYFGYSWTTLRGTPGMKLLGLQIGDERDGHSIDWRQAAVRWLILGVPSILSTFASYVSSGLGFVLSLVGLIWLLVLLWTIAQSPTKQGLHDRVARTILVKAARRVA